MSNIFSLPTIASQSSQQFRTSSFLSPCRQYCQTPTNCSKIIKEERTSINLLSSSAIPTAIYNSILFFCYHENSSLYTRKRGKRRLQRKATLRTSTAHLDSFDMPKALLLERYYLSQDFFFKYKFSEQFAVSCLQLRVWSCNAQRSLLVHQTFSYLRLNVWSCNAKRSLLVHQHVSQKHQSDRTPSLTYVTTSLCPINLNAQRNENLKILLINNKYSQIPVLVCFYVTLTVETVLAQSNSILSQFHNFKNSKLNVFLGSPTNYIPTSHPRFPHGRRREKFFGASLQNRRYYPIQG